MMKMPTELVDLRNEHHIKLETFWRTCSLRDLAIHMCLHSRHVGFVKDALGAIYSRCHNPLVKEYVLENLAEEAGKQSPDGPPEDHGNMINAFCADQGLDMRVGDGGSTIVTQFDKIKKEWFSAGWHARGLHYRSVAEREQFDTVFAHFWIQESQLVELNEEVLIPKLLESGYDRDDPKIRWFTSHGRNDIEHSQKWVKLYHLYANGETVRQSGRTGHCTYSVCKTGLELRIASIRELEHYLKNITKSQYMLIG